MTIHTLHDLCYAYAVADPVREMLFALQDRIDALEAQRKPLSDEEITDVFVECLLPDGEFDEHEFARAIEERHGIK